MRVFAVLSLASLVTLGCPGTTQQPAGDEDAAIPDVVEPLHDGFAPDRIEAGGIRVDEGHISLSASGEELFAELVITRTAAAEGEVTGEVAIALARVSQGELADATHSQAAFVLPAQDESVTVAVGPLVNPLGSGIAESALGGFVLDWSVDVGPERLAGRRSAWQAWSTRELTIWAPTTALVGVASEARVTVREASTQAPVEGAVVELGAGAEFGSGTTDVTGAWSSAFTFDQVSNWKLYARAYHGPFRSTVRFTVEVRPPDARVLLTTDKPLYQPGQRIHARALALRVPGGAPAADEAVTFTLVDPKGNKIARRSTTTDSHGIAATELPLGAQLNLGKYDLVAEVADQQEVKGIKVARYNLPKFKLGVTLDQPVYLAGETVGGAIHAYYLFGQKVDGGTVEIDVLDPSGAPTGLPSMLGATNAEGLFDFVFDLPADLSPWLTDGDGMLLLAITVTDAAGQVQEKVWPVLLTAQPLRIYLVPEASPLVAGLEHDFYLLITDALGTPTAGDATVTIGGAAPFAVTVGDAGHAAFSHVADGPLDIDVAVDAAGQQVQQQFGFAATSAGKGVLVRTDRAVYQVGDVMQISVASETPDGVMHLDVVRNGQTLAMDSSPLVDGAAQFQVDVGKGWDGELWLHATAAWGGASTSGQRMVYVYRDRKLNVSFGSDKEVYAPGDPLVLQVDVTDESGAPASAALGLTIVDEALYAIQDAKPGLLWRHFEVGSAMAEPSWKHPFPVKDVLALTEGLPDESDPAFEAAQQKAAAGFAALASLNFTASSESGLAELVDEARYLARGLTTSQVGAFRSELRQLAEQGVFDTSTVSQYVSSKTWRDVFGQPFKVVVYEDSHIRFDSAGMDEGWGSADDTSNSIYWWDIFWDWWPDAGMVMDAAAVADSVWWWEAGAADAGPAPDVDPSLPSAAPSVKPRRWFPETLYVAPAIITDGAGKASVEVGLADSITQWRATGLANSADGRLGSATHPITVFQEFFVDPDLPVSVTRNDQLTFPVAVYNYLSQPQTVTVELEAAGWFEIVGPAQAQVTVAAQSVGSAAFTIKLIEVGWHSMTVNGSAQGVEDLIMRTVEVLPDGVPHLTTAAGTTTAGASGSFVVPADVVPGSQHGLLKLYGEGMAHVVEGVDSILQYPFG